MTEIKVNGLVVQEREIGENDKLLTVLTERYGKVFVIGKGVRSLKNRNMCCSHIFTYASFGLRRRGNYYYIVDSDLIESFFDIRNDLSKLSLSIYVCDVVNHVAQEGQAEDDILRLALNVLFAIKQNVQSLEIIRAAFQIRIVSLLGMAPDVSCCSVCGEENVSKGYLDLIDGIIVCNDCKEVAARNAVDSFSEYGLNKPIAQISAPIIETIEYIINADPKRFLSFSLAEDELISFFDASEKFLLNQLERGFYSLDFYKTMLI